MNIEATDLKSFHTLEELGEATGMVPRGAGLWSQLHRGQAGEAGAEGQGTRVRHGKGLFHTSTHVHPLMLSVSSSKMGKEESGHSAFSQRHPRACVERSFLSHIYHPPELFSGLGLQCRARQMRPLTSQSWILVSRQSRMCCRTVETTSQVPHCCSRVLSSCSGSQRAAPCVPSRSSARFNTLRMNPLGTSLHLAPKQPLFPAQLLRISSHFKSPARPGSYLSLLLLTPQKIPPLF